MQHTTIKISPKKAKKATRKLENGRVYPKGTRSYAQSADEMALKHSRYLHSILDPFEVTGVKIPDEVTLPSFPMSATSKVAINAIAGTGVGPNGRGVNFIVGSSGSNNSQKYTILNPTVTADTYVTAAPIGAFLPGTQLQTIASSVRPVSAGLFVNVQGAENTNQGRIIIGFLPPNDPLSGVASGVGNNVTATALDNAAYTTSFPVSKVSGRSIYLPLDDLARTYLTSGQIAQGSGSNRQGNALQYGALVCLVDGCAVSALPAMEFTYVENWECIPINSQINIAQPEVSASDPLEMACASNFIAAHPTVAMHQVQADQVSGTPMSGALQRTSDDSPKLMDQVLGALSTGAKLVKKWSPVVAEVAGLFL